MDKDALITVLKTQATVQTTQFGWDFLVEGVDQIALQSLIAASDQSVDTLFKSCRNCGFLASAEYFAQGCPNCGIKGEMEDVVIGDKEVVKH